MRVLNITLIISIVILYITYLKYYNELDSNLSNSELSNALQSSYCGNMLLILITLLGTITLDSITLSYIMGSYAKPVYNFSTLLYIATALMTIDIYATRSPIRFIFYNSLQKVLAIYGGCVIFTMKNSKFNSWYKVNFFIVCTCSLYASVVANIPVYTSIANAVRPVLIAIYFPLLIQLFLNYFDGLKLKLIDSWYIIVLPFMICLDLYVCYPYVNRFHGIDVVASRIAISIFYFFISSYIENIPMYKSSKRAKDKLLLLSKMFPLKVLNELIEKKEVTPTVQTGVTVLFSDIKEFVKICSEIGAIDTFSLLNKLYHVLDLCCEVCGCYKVETIGDGN